MIKTPIVYICNFIPILSSFLTGVLKMKRILFIYFKFSFFTFGKPLMMACEGSESARDNSSTNSNLKPKHLSGNLKGH